ncbi:MAG: hypothetical protein FWE34_02975 [Defluviitaleaceae bacterium]|nr:hypothetical protein [Defluviitaleaceae bacterium]
MIRQVLSTGALIAVFGIGNMPFTHNNYYENINYSGIDEPQIVANTYIAKYDATWFNEIQHIFARDTDAVVRDIGTGHTFNIRRTFGTNHADIEPLTKEDAAIMNEIWGGHSWARRPVVVYVGNYVFAGSLTNFPHAGVDGEPALAVVNSRSGGYGRGLNFDAVKGNGVDGHMCLHFAGSLIHGSNRSNLDHQNAVGQAIEYIRANY